MAVGILGRGRSKAIEEPKKTKEPVAKPAPKQEPESKRIQAGQIFTLPNGVNVVYVDSVDNLQKVKDPPMYCLGIVKTENTIGASFTEFKYLLGGWKLMLSANHDVEQSQEKAYKKGFYEGQKEAEKKFTAKCRDCREDDDDDWEYDDEDDDEW